MFAFKYRYLSDNIAWSLLNKYLLSDYYVSGSDRSSIFLLMRLSCVVRMFVEVRAFLCEAPWRGQEATDTDEALNDWN